MKLRLITLLLFSQSFQLLFAQSSKMTIQPSADSLIQTVRELTGAAPIRIHGETDTIKTREAFTTGNRLASEFILEKMKAAGLETEVQSFHPNTFGMTVEFTDLCTTPKDKFPLWFCTNWGEIFNSNDSTPVLKTSLSSAVPETDRLDWIRALNSKIIVALGKNGSFAKTTDGGKSWTRSQTFLRDIKNLLLSPAGIIIATAEGGVIWRSGDLGNSWTRAVVDVSFRINDGAFLGEKKVFLVGQSSQALDGTLWISSDDGISWEKSPAVFKASLNAIFALDSVNAWIADSDGIVYKTDSGGKTWAGSAISSSHESTRKIFFSDRQHGWILSRSNVFSRSTDGGTIWNNISAIDTPSYISNFCFIDSFNGFLAGKEYSGRRTTDGGMSWRNGGEFLLKIIVAKIKGTRKPDNYILLTAHSDCTLNFPEREKRYLTAPGADDDASGTAAVMELARIFEANPLPFTIVFGFLPDEELAGIGTFKLAERLLKQPDSLHFVMDFDMVGFDSYYPGYITMSTYNADSIKSLARFRHIIDSLKLPLKVVSWENVTPANAGGFIDKGIPIIGLMDGGGPGTKMNPYYHKLTDTWSTLDSGYLADITQTAGTFIADYVYSITGPDTPDDPPPSSFVLESPFPNPFNSTVNIHFALPGKYRVNLIIYDILGREVSRIINSELISSGYLKYQWVAGSHSSGIYLCRIEAYPEDGIGATFTETRKIILLK